MFVAVDHHNWPDVVFALVVAIPGMIAAGSSLWNHHKLTRNAEKLEENTALTEQVKTIVNGNSHK